MVQQILKRSFSVLAKFPVKLWGLSVLCSVLMIIIFFAGLLVPIISIPIILTISTRMYTIYLNGYMGVTPETPQLFDGFKKENFARVCGGSCWKALWSFLWAFVPIVGIVKSYQYIFTPFILMQRPEIGATQAIKVSMRETQGYKGKMFLTQVCLVFAVYVVMGLLTWLSVIPFIGVIFAVLSFLFDIAVALFLPLLQGLITAGFYDASQHPQQYAPVYTQYNSGTPYGNQFYGGTYNPSSQVPPTGAENGTSESTDNEDWKCSECGTENAAGTNFCRACGRANPNRQL